MDNSIVPKDKGIVGIGGISVRLIKTNFKGSLLNKVTIGTSYLKVIS